MKKFGGFLLIIMLVIGSLPSSVFAAKAPSFEQDFSAYLADISKQRGFTVTRDDVDYALDTNETIDDFDTVAELKKAAGPVIQKNLSNLGPLYKKYQLTEKSLKSLLAENDETLDDYVFYNDLDSSIFYSLEANKPRDPQFNQKLLAYLKEISKERGFTVTKSDVEYVLTEDDDDLDTFNTVDELKEYLGPVIHKDLSNLQPLYKKYQLNQASLVQLLKENGQTLNDYVFVDYLWSDVDFYIEDKKPRDEQFDQKLDQYLQKVSKERGFNVTKDDIETILDYYYDEKLEDYKTVDELSDMLGEVIQKDLSNLTPLYEEYDLTEASLRKLLADNDETVNDYIFYDDLDSAVYDYTGGDESYNGDMFEALAEELGLTQEELERLSKHFETISAKPTDPEELQRLSEISDSLGSIGDFDTLTELSPADLNKIRAAYEELLSMLELKASFKLIVGDQKKPITFEQLLQLKNIDNAKVEVTLYDKAGVFLADFVITGEMFGSDFIEETENNLEQGATEEEKPADKPAPSSTKEGHAAPVKGDHQVVTKTENGARLPDTASSYPLAMMIGAGMIVAGFFMFRKVRQN
ncbi:processed acidic surface protein [Priestia koreensis]|uniref:processed acidic surface protein n=1 Tax=Priestia koreensis TaxID=284581 RepID=UPI0028F738D1|nr:processed acidic surface protein [Priestia koreensis]